MSAAVLPPKPLADSTNTRKALSTPSAGKKRRHDGSPVSVQTPRQFKKSGPHLGSSQPKSQFEEEVLEKLTQDISSLKKNNAEKDQQWARPRLEDFNEHTDSICFQQVDAEEGTLRGGEATVRFYGTTEVIEYCLVAFTLMTLIRSYRTAIQSCFTSQTFSTIFTSKHLPPLQNQIVKDTKHIWRLG